MKDIITYPDLRSEVLQNFRELGNILIFMKIIDLALVCFHHQTSNLIFFFFFKTQEDDFSFIVAAPFLGIVPEQSHEPDPSRSSPLYNAASNLATALENRPIAKAPTILREVLNNAWKADKFYRPPPQNVSLFKSVLQRISAMLDSGLILLTLFFFFLLKFIISSSFLGWNTS